MFDNPFGPSKQKRKNDDPLGLGNISPGVGRPRNEPKRDSRRSFTTTQKNEIWAQQNGKCAKCKSKLDPRTTEYDHGKEWAEGGKTTIKNGRALCANCHKLKTHRTRLKNVDKKRKPKDDNSFGGGLFGSPSPKGRGRGPFDIGL